MAKSSITNITKEVTKTVVETVQVKRITLVLTEREAALIECLTGNISGHGPIRDLADGIYVNVCKHVITPVCTLHPSILVENFDYKYLEKFDNTQD